MKIKTMANVLIGMVALSGAALAAADTYLPPEHLNCNLNGMGKLSCHEFDRNLLVEDTYTADLPPGKEVMFTFATGVAYFTGQHDWAIYYTYIDMHNKSVKLRTTHSNTKPVLTNAGWVKYKEEFYTCKMGYMGCGISR